MVPSVRYPVPCRWTLARLSRRSSQAIRRPVPRGAAPRSSAAIVAEQVLLLGHTPRAHRPEPDGDQAFHPQFAAQPARWRSRPRPASSACSAAWRAPAAARWAVRPAVRATAPARRRDATGTRRFAASAGRTAGRGPARRTAVRPVPPDRPGGRSRNRIAARPGNRSRARASGRPAARAAAATLTARQPFSAASWKAAAIRARSNSASSMAGSWAARTHLSALRTTGDIRLFRVRTGR